MPYVSLLIMFWHKFLKKTVTTALEPTATDCWTRIVTELEEVSTHKSVKTHSGTVFVPHNLDLWPFNPNITATPGLMVKHFYVKSGNPSCIDFWDIVLKNRHTDVGVSSLSNHPHLLGTYHKHAKAPAHIHNIQVFKNPLSLSPPGVYCCWQPQSGPAYLGLLTSHFLFLLFWSCCVYGWSPNTDHLVLLEKVI